MFFVVKSGSAMLHLSLNNNALLPHPQAAGMWQKSTGTSSSSRSSNRPAEGSTKDTVKTRGTPTELDSQQKQSNGVGQEPETSIWQRDGFMMAGVTWLTAYVRYSTCPHARERDRETVSWGTLRVEGTRGKMKVFLFWIGGMKP